MLAELIRRFAILCALIVTLPCVAYAQVEPFEVAFPLDGVLVGKHLEVLQDSSGKLTASQVFEGTNTLLFSPSVALSPSFGFSSVPYWAKFRVRNSGEHSRKVYFEFPYPMMDSLSIFYREPKSGLIHSEEIGDRTLFSSRNVASRFPTFAVEVPKGDHIFLFKAKTTGTMTLPLTVWSEYEYAKHTRNDSILLGVFFGILVAMLVYSVFLYLTMRHRTYLSYLVYLVFFVSHLLVSQGVIQLAPFAAIGDFWASNEGFLVSAQCSVIALTIFAMLFLNVRQNFSRIFPALIGLLVLQAGGVLLTQFGSYELAARVVNGNIALSMILLTAFGWYSAYKRYRPGYYFSAAFSFTLLANVVMTLRYQGVIDATPITNWPQLVAGSVEAVLLTLAITDSFNTYRFSTEATIGKLHAQLSKHEEDSKAVTGLVSEISGGVAQSINIPLLMAQDNLQALKGSLGNTGVSESSDTPIQRVEESLARIRTIVDGLISYSRKDHTANSVPFRKESVEDIFKEAVREFVRRANGLNVTLSYNGAEADCDVECRRDELALVFAHILMNALDAIEESAVGKEENWVRAWISDSKDVVRVRIENSGPHIPQQFAARIFEPFFSTKEPSKRVGLGLSIAAGVVRDHGGKIFYDAKGPHPAFMIELPRVVKTSRV